MGECNTILSAYTLYTHPSISFCGNESKFSLFHAIKLLITSNKFLRRVWCKYLGTFISWIAIIQNLFLLIYLGHAQAKGGFMHFCYTLTVSQTSPGFYESAVQIFLKTRWVEEKLLVMSNFSFSHGVFYPFGELSAIFIEFKMVVCKLFQFGRV